MSSVPATSDAIPCFFARKTIQEELSELVDITSFEDLKVRYEAIDRRYGRSKIRVDLATFVMNSAQVYLFENCSSIYSLLGSYPYPGFPHEKSSIHDALKRGEAAVVLTGPTYRGHMIEYLQELGPAAGRGMFREDGQPLGFTLDDFALHKTKLPLLYELVQSAKDYTEPNWRRFFGASFPEYKQYCFGKLKKKAGGSYDRGDPGSPAHRPGGGVADAGHDELAELDPFAKAANAQATADGGAPELPASKPRPFKIPRLCVGDLPIGTLPSVDWLLPRTHKARSE